MGLLDRLLMLHPVVGDYDKAPRTGRARGKPECPRCGYPSKGCACNGSKPRPGARRSR
jgi:hypothetical protein